MSNTCWFLIQEETILVAKNNSFPNTADMAKLNLPIIRSFELGSYQGIDYFCAEIQAEDQNIFNRITLREALSLFTLDKFQLGVKAYTVINWDRNHQFCGRCGEATLFAGKNFERTCPSCNMSFYPRISPSVIVLIHRDDHLLMARSPHFLPGVYGLIAGFVEPGESLEEAVHREVMEEVGLRIKNLSYFGSQPWPFPDSLVVAYTAEYESGEIVMEPEEIEDAGWYRYDNLPGRPSTAFSIASLLLNSFIARWQGKF
jgi:NAD+ diphosphatase